MLFSLRSYCLSLSKGKQNIEKKKKGEWKKIAQLDENTALSNY